MSNTKVVLPCSNFSRVCKPVFLPFVSFILSGSFVSWPLRSNCITEKPHPGLPYESLLLKYVIWGLNFYSSHQPYIWLRSSSVTKSYTHKFNLLRSLLISPKFFWYLVSSRLYFISGLSAGQRRDLCDGRKHYILGVNATDSKLHLYISLNISFTNGY